MAKTEVITLDLDFQGKREAVAVYLIKHSTGAILIECGPSSNSSRASSGTQSKWLIRI